MLIILSTTCSIDFNSLKQGINIDVFMNYLILNLKFQNTTEIEVNKIRINSNGSLCPIIRSSIEKLAIIKKKKNIFIYTINFVCSIKT